MGREKGLRYVAAAWTCVLALAVMAGSHAQQSAPAQPASPAPESLPDRRVEERVEALLGQMTLEEKIDLLGGIDGFYTRGIDRLGLPRLKMSDGPAGARNDGPATTMAGGIALAATWNVALAREVGTQIGRDARARGVHFMLGPGVNIHVAPMNGRNFEYFGEDPFLASRITVAYVEGMQAQGVSATVKHFMGNNSEFDRHNADAVIDERSMREIYLPAFEAAVKEAHVGAIMTSYNLVNGAHMSQQGLLNTDVVKKEWGFDGLVMSDWFATYDGVAAANGGLDLEMPSGAFMNRKTLLPAVKDGKVALVTIDDKVCRILRTAVRFGWLDRPQLDPSIPVYNRHGNQAALEAAREGSVLLKNDGNLLPLDKEKIRTIAVIGPVADPAVPVGGGSGAVQPFASVSILKGLSDEVGTSTNVTYHRGLPTWARLANTTQFLTAPTGGKPGLTVETFENPDLSGVPASTRIERHVNLKPPFDIADLADMDMSEIFATAVPGGPPPPSKGSSTRWTGYYVAKATGAFEVFVQASGERGGHRLLIDDRVVLDNWSVRRAILDHANVTLTAGPHKVVLEVFHGAEPDFLGGLLRVGVAAQDSLVDPAAKTLAARADVVVVAAGFDAEIETEGGDRTFRLPFGQDQLIREISAANRNTVVVVTSGGAVDARAWIDKVPALVAAWFPGQEGGTALAEILLGSVNPSGRLPISYDRTWDENPSKDSYYPEPGTRRVVYRNGVFVGYRGYDHNGTAPLFPFGHGLSYTTFKYDRLAITPAGSDRGRPSYEVTFDVTNTGTRAGAEVAQLYVGEVAAKVPRPPQELKGFARVELQPGETKRVTIRVDARGFAYFDVATRRWRIDPGEYQVLVGRSSAQIELRGKLVMADAVALDPGK
jgi:beta-glucosidase